MKSILLLCSFCILFTSCYSYKPYSGNPTEVSIDKKYHFDLTNGKEFNRKIDSVDTSAYYVTRRGKSQKIDFSEVDRLEEGNFSTGKTFGFSGVIALGAATVAAFIVLVTNAGR